VQAVCFSAGIEARELAGEQLVYEIKLKSADSTPIRSSNGRYQDAAGQVAARKTLLVTDTVWITDEARVSIPVQELELQPSDFPVFADFGVCRASGERLARITRRLPLRPQTPPSAGASGAPSGARAARPAVIPSAPPVPPPAAKVPRRPPTAQPTAPKDSGAAATQPSAARGTRPAPATQPVVPRGFKKPPATQPRERPGAAAPAATPPKSAVTTRPAKSPAAATQPTSRPRSRR
jgi:hypothetical protein